METAVEYLTEWYWGLFMLGILAGAAYAAYRFVPAFRGKVDERADKVREGAVDILKDPRD